MKIASVETARGITIATHVGVAEHFLHRFRGLMGRRHLPLDHGLLLRPGGSIHTLCMRFAIDALFLDRHMRILAVAHRVAPNRIALAPRLTRSVLELAEGRAAACDLEPGVALLLRLRRPS